MQTELQRRTSADIDTASNLSDGSSSAADQQTLQRAGDAAVTRMAQDGSATKGPAVSIAAEGASPLGSLELYADKDEAALDARTDSYMNNEMARAEAGTHMTEQQFVAAQGGDAWLNATRSESREILDSDRREAIVQPLFCGAAVADRLQVTDHTLLAFSKTFSWPQDLSAYSSIEGNPADNLARLRFLARLKEIGVAVALKPDEHGQYSTNAPVPASMESVAVLGRVASAFGFDPQRIVVLDPTSRKLVGLASFAAVLQGASAAS